MNKDIIDKNLIYEEKLQDNIEKIRQIILPHIITIVPRSV